ncbi:MAG: hypothetical protein Q8W45_10650 [Candidatus Palauibacterales bacterium]|nr:hypothetical protein [Candidatus Palauibacterales bacterium]MDP2483734.1 hypothetical protein [Candidatus Palauibacterales bacterium]
MRFVLAAVLVCLFTIPSRAGAQEAQKWEGADWYRIVQVDYYNGKADDARRIIEEHYMPAGEAAGTPTPVMLLWNETGEWDLTIIWHMKDGPSSMEWRRSPDSVTWWQAFVEREGGEEAAEKIQEEYSSLVARSTSEIARSM